MAIRIQADRIHVVRRLKELRDWARYIQESVSEDQPYEHGKMSLLEKALGEEALLVLRSDAVGLLNRIEATIDRIECASGSPSKTGAGQTVQVD
jgi:hypothetical protein